MALVLLGISGGIELYTESKSVIISLDGLPPF